MNEVYVVTSGDYSDYHIDEIFSSNEDALDIKRCFHIALLLVGNWRILVVLNKS
jgi:hypothetical protein